MSGQRYGRFSLRAIGGAHFSAETQRGSSTQLGVSSARSRSPIGQARACVDRILGNPVLQRSISADVRPGTTSQSSSTWSTSAEARAVEEEMQQRYPNIYRSGETSSVSDRRCQLPHTVTAAPYLPRHNYNPTSIRPRRRSVVQIAATARARIRDRTPITTSGSQPGYVTRQSRTFTRNVVIVECGNDVVPKGKARQTLHDDGCVIDMMDFAPTWSEDRVRYEIEKRLPMIDKSQSPPRFRFMKPCYGKLKVPNVDEDLKWTGERVKQNSAQGDVYVQALHPFISVKQENEESDNCGGKGGESDDSLSGGMNSGDNEESHFTSSPPWDNRREEESSSPIIDLTNTKVEDEDADRLAEMFPNSPPMFIRKLVMEKGSDFDKIVNILLSQSGGPDDQSSSCSTSFQPSYDPLANTAEPCRSDRLAVVPKCDLPTDAPMESILRAHADHIIDFDRDLPLEMARKDIWRRAQSFYKVALTSPKRLMRNLVVEFDDEEGVDAGAIRNDFFEHIISKIDEELFEGQALRRVPKNDWELNKEFEMAGAMIAHSVLQGGPGFAALSPVLYSFVLSGDRDCLLDELPLLDDIPQTSATCDLLELIDKLDAATSNEDINVLLDTPKYMTVISCSGWSPTKVINMASRNELLQGLVYQEVIHKREAQISSFRRGLDVIGFLQLLQNYPDKLKPVLVYTPVPITPSLLKSLISSSRPKAANRATVYDWFMEYIQERKSDDGRKEFKATLRDVLMFCTGHSRLPPMGLKQLIRIDYLPCSEDHILPTAAACFSVICLPTYHGATCKEDFCNMMDKGILYSIGHYGQT